MISQRINKRLSMVIMSITVLNIVALAFYLYDVLPKTWNPSTYFWLISNTYIILLTLMFSIVVVDKDLKKALRTSLWIYILYTMLINGRLVWDGILKWSESTWGIICLILILIPLIISCYGRSLR